MDNFIKIGNVTLAQLFLSVLYQTGLGGFEIAQVRVAIDRIVQIFALQINKDNGADLTVIVLEKPQDAFELVVLYALTKKLTLGSKERPNLAVLVEGVPIWLVNKAAEITPAQRQTTLSVWMVRARRLVKAEVITIPERDAISAAFSAAKTLFK
jgi:hypothetical protein